MNTMLTIAYRCQMTGSVILALMALVYLTRKQFMPYHAVALGQRWEQLEAPSQTLILTSMRLIGSAWLALAVGLIIVLRHGVRAGLPWAVYGVPAIGLLVSVPTLLAVLRVKATTKASPPWRPLALMALLFLAGLLFSLGA
jgi:hypothetical protein